MWPENMAAVVLFNRIGSQWRTGMSGPTGLDYSVLFRLMDHMGLEGDDWMQMLLDIQVLETAALNELHSRD